MTETKPPLGWSLDARIGAAHVGDPLRQPFEQLVMATLLAILKSQLENLNSDRYLSMWFRTLMNVSCARSSAVALSRTMRKTSENTGRS